jgi:hypothetical protein
VARVEDFIAGGEFFAAHAREPYAQQPRDEDRSGIICHPSGREIGLNTRDTTLCMITKL